MKLIVRHQHPSVHVIRSPDIAPISSNGLSRRKGSTTLFAFWQVFAASIGHETMRTQLWRALCPQAWNRRGTGPEAKAVARSADSACLLRRKRALCSARGEVSMPRAT